MIYLVSRAKYLFLVTLVTLFLLASPIGALAATLGDELPPPVFPFPTDPMQFLLWLAGPTSAGVLVALLYERRAWFQALDPKRKGQLVFGTFLSLPVLAVFGQWALGAQLTLPSGEGVALYQAWANYVLNLLMQGLTAWGVSQYAHKYDPERE